MQLSLPVIFVLLMSPSAYADHRLARWRGIDTIYGIQYTIIVDERWRNYDQDLRNANYEMPPKLKPYQGQTKVTDNY